MLQHNLICRHLEIFLELEILANFMQSVHEIYRVLSSREEGLFPVVDKSNFFFQTFLTRSTSLLIWSETNTFGNVPL